jgi:hypothetical protein
MRASPFLLATVMLLAGCAVDAGRSADAAIAEGASAALELQVPARGFQLESGAILLEPGEEMRWCETLRLPGGPEDVYYVNRIEAAMSPEGQDLIVSVAELGSQTEAIMEPGSRVPCTRAGEAFGEELFQITSTQHARRDQRYPELVGQVLYGGQKLALDYRFVSASDQPVATAIKLNFHTVDESRVQRLARTAGFHNLTIYTPPGGQSSHLAECRVSQELVVGELVRRTQSRGTDFRVWIAGGLRDGELLWHSPEPADSELELPAPVQLLPGEGLRFECDYQNTTNLELRFGVNAGDELCTLDATYWLPDELTAATPQGCLLLGVDPDGVARK